MLAHGPRLRMSALGVVVLLCLFLGVAFGTSGGASAQPQTVGPAQPPRGRPPFTLPPAGPNASDDERLRIFVLTFSPGDEAFYKFGHNAIWVHDETRLMHERDRVFNWGTFNFGDPALIPKFVVGRFMYWLSVGTMQATMYTYRRENRSIVSQELDLDLETKRRMVGLLIENAKPENRYYKYDYYRDNCSTRVRDMLDGVLDGRVKAAATEPARLTFRQHTLRLTADLPWEYVALNLALADLTDKPGTKFDEAFIPMELAATLSRVTIEGKDGVERPLVKEEKLILPAKRAPPPENPPPYWPYSLAAGIAFGGGFATLGWFGKTARAARALYGLGLSLWGLLLGFLGTFFLFVWLGTDHAFGYGNENTLLCVPWGLWLTGTGVRVALGRARSVRVAFVLTRLALGTTVLATALKVLPWFDQENGFFLVFFLPFWGGVFFGARELEKVACVRARLVDVLRLRHAATIAGR